MSGPAVTLERASGLEGSPGREAVWEDGPESDAAAAVNLALGVLGGGTVAERPWTSADIRVAVVAASPAVQAGLVDFLERAGYRVVEASGDGIVDAEGEAVDVVVADLDERLGLDVGDVRERVGEVAAVFLASGIDAERDASLRRAATGWLRREASAEELEAAVRAVVAGLDVVGPGLRGGLTTRGNEADAPSPLTEREREVLELVASGLPNKGIARALGISEHTVKFHVGAVLSKLEAQSRTEAVSIAARRGLMTL